MKINFFNEDNITIQLNDFYITELDLEQKDNLEQYFKQLFLRLHQFYGIKIKGYYNIIVYHDQQYGLVISLQKEAIDYYDFFDNEVDMRIIIDRGKHFLYQIDDYFFLDEEMKKVVNLYSYQKKLYLQVKEKLKPVKLGYLLEHSKLIYQNTDMILKRGILYQL